jgi:hypothetical protein
MSTVEKNYFVEHRVKALANVFLMSRNSIVTYEVTNFGEVDLLARYLPEGDTYEKLFAVILKGTTQPLPDEHHATNFLNSWAKQGYKRIQLFPFPVMILAFSMQNDDGYYAWRLEPTCSLGGAQLRYNRSFSPQRANKKGLDSVSKLIDDWYDKEYRKITGLML